MTGAAFGRARVTKEGEMAETKTDALVADYQDVDEATSEFESSTRVRRALSVGSE